MQRAAGVWLQALCRAGAGGTAAFSGKPSEPMPCTPLPLLPPTSHPCLLRVPGCPGASLLPSIHHASHYLPSPPLHPKTLPLTERRPCVGWLHDRTAFIKRRVFWIKVIMLVAESLENSGKIKELK